MDAHHEIERGLDAMIEQASVYGNVSDELLPYRTKIVAAYDAGASAQKIADFLSATLGRKISKDRVFRFCERYGARRKRRRKVGDGDPAAPAAAPAPNPRPARPRRGGQPYDENPTPPAPLATEQQPGPPDPGTPAGTVTRFDRKRNVG